MNEDDHEEKPDVATQQGAEAQPVDDAAPPPAEPPPPIAAAPAPPPVPPPSVVMSDEECDALLALHGWDAEAVRNHLITPQLVCRAKGKQWAAYDASYQDAFNPEIHFSTANGSGDAELWWRHVDHQFELFIAKWKALRSAGRMRDAIRLAKAFEQQLIAWAALPVAQKISLEQVAAAQARVVAGHAAMARSAAIQFPDQLPSGRLAAYRRAGMTLTPTADGEDILVSGHQHRHQLDQIKAEKPILLAALKAEKPTKI